MRIAATIYNSIDVNIFPFYSEPENPPYLAFLGRISPDKGVHIAIEIAQKTGWTLTVDGQVFMQQRSLSRKLTFKRGDMVP